MPYDDGPVPKSAIRRAAYQRKTTLLQDRRRWLGAARGSSPQPLLGRRYLSQSDVGMLAPNLRPEWIKNFYAGGGNVYFDSARPNYSETPGLGRRTEIALQPTALGLPGVLGHEAVHATLRQPLGGLPNQLLMFGGAVNALLQPGRALTQGPLEAMRRGALEWSEAPAYQVGGQERSGYLEDIPPLLRPLFSGIVRTKSGA